MNPPHNLKMVCDGLSLFQIMTYHARSIVNLCIQWVSILVIPDACITLEISRDLVENESSIVECFLLHHVFSLSLFLNIKLHDFLRACQS